MLKARMSKLQCADVPLTPAYPSAACPDSSHGSLHSCGKNIHQGAWVRDRLPFPLTSGMRRYWWASWWVRG